MNNKKWNEMKNKLKLIFGLLLLLQVHTFGQDNSNNGLFSSRNVQDEYPPHRGDPSGGSPGGEPVPIGSGLLVLTGLSIGYACFKRNRKEDWKIFEYYKMGWFAISIFLYFQKFFIDNKINIIKHYNV